MAINFIIIMSSDLKDGSDIVKEGDNVVVLDTGVLRELVMKPDQIYCN